MNVVVTLSIGDASSAIAPSTVPIMKAYAQRLGCDFICIDQELIRACHPKFEKFQLFSILERYQRALFLDLDTIVMPGCPDLFEIVPENRFGAYFDSNGGNGDADLGGKIREDEMAAVQTAFGDVGWRRDYFNTGVMLIPASHREVFDFSWGLTRVGRFVDQTIINYRLQRLRLPYFDIGQSFNHFAALARSPRMLGTRFKANIIHYAGFSEFYPELSLRQQIAEDCVIAYGSRTLGVGEIAGATFS